MKHLPRGLVFFSRGASRNYRYQRIFFVVIILVASIALIWPVYTLFAHATPLIFGFPPSLSWNVLWLAIVMGALTWIYRSE